MNPVVCVTEFSDLTVDAARVAAGFARQWGEQVVLVRSVDEREQFAYPLRQRLLPQDRRRLAEEAKRLRQLGFDFEEKAVCGMPEEGIAGLAWKAGARLVVVGCAATARLEHWALGCIAEEITDTSLVPVLAVRTADPFVEWFAGNRPLKVFVGADPASRPDALLNRLDELRDLGPCEIAAGFIAYPENVTTAPTPEPADAEGHPFRLDADFKAAMSRELEARGIPVVDLHAGRDKAAELVRRTLEAAADLLVIDTHPLADLTLLPHPALAHGVLCTAPMSVLCVPEAAIEPPKGAVSDPPRDEHLRNARVGHGTPAHRGHGEL